MDNTAMAFINDLPLKITVHSPIEKTIEGNLEEVVKELTFLKCCYGSATYTLEVNAEREL